MKPWWRRREILVDQWRTHGYLVAAILLPRCSKRKTGIQNKETGNQFFIYILWSFVAGRQTTDVIIINEKQKSKRERESKNNGFSTLLDRHAWRLLGSTVWKFNPGWVCSSRYAIFSSSAAGGLRYRSRSEMVGWTNGKLPPILAIAE